MPQITTNADDFKQLDNIDLIELKLVSGVKVQFLRESNNQEVYLKDLNQSKDRLSAIECNGILKLCFGTIKYIVNMIKIKAKHKEKEVIKKNIKIVK